MKYGKQSGNRPFSQLGQTSRELPTQRETKLSVKGKVCLLPFSFPAPILSVLFAFRTVVVIGSRFLFEMSAAKLTLAAHHQRRFRCGGGHGVTRLM